MVIKTVNLETVCGITSVVPDSPYPEVAFAGKSNVGKSSLINVLMNRKSLARTSSKPGKTQTINFYNINDRMYLVDLPGYGYASANVAIKAKWGQMIEHYLHVSQKLCAVFLLVDIRHEPSENDRMMYDWIRSQGFAPIIIATKADKVNRSRLEAHLNKIREGLSLPPDAVVLPFSAETRQGREEIWKWMDSFVLPESSDESPEKKSPEGKNPKGKSPEGKSPEEKTASERKPRWKAQGKPVAKKTAKMAAKRAQKKRRP